MNNNDDNTYEQHLRSSRLGFMQTNGVHGATQEKLFARTEILETLAAKLQDRLRGVPDGEEIAARINCQLVLLSKKDNAKFLEFVRRLDLATTAPINNAIESIRVIEAVLSQDEAKD